MLPWFILTGCRKRHPLRYAQRSSNHGVFGVSKSPLFYSKKHRIFIKNCTKNAKKSRFATFWGKIGHFMGFPPFCPLFHRSFAHPRWKMGEVPPFCPQKMGKKGVKLSHFQRSFPQKNCRKPLILLGFRRFSTVCSQVKNQPKLFLNFGVIFGGFSYRKTSG